MLSRRSLLTTTAGAALASSLSPATLTAAPHRKIRVGALNVGEYSFWGIWADILSPQGTFGTPLLDMEITHCWDVNADRSRQFAKRYGCQPVATYDGMLGEVDAIAFGGLYEVPWQHQLARPYVDAGVPTYLSRPFSYRLRDIDELLELAAKRGTPLMASSCQEHLHHATQLKSQLSKCGTIKAVQGTCSSQEFPAHFHIQWFLPRALGYDVDQVGLITDDERKSTYLQETMLFQGTDSQPPYLAALQAASGSHHLYVQVIGEEGTQSISMDRSPNRREELYSYFAPQLVDMQRTFAGQPFQPLDIIRKKTQLFLAGSYSHLVRKGTMVPVDEVPLDWSPRHFKPGWIDEKLFKN